MQTKKPFTIEVSDMLEKTVLTVLQFRVGQENSVGRFELVDLVAKHGVHEDERVVRAAVQTLRKKGVLICSTGGTGGGYWMAKDWKELESFLDHEVRSRAFDLLEQEKAMKTTARQKWGAPSPQIQLGI